MSFKRLTALAAATVLACAPLCAQQAPAAAAAPKAEAPAPKFNPDDLLKIIPDTLGEYTVDGNTVKVDSTTQKAGLKAELEMLAKQGADIKPDMIKQIIPRMAEQVIMDKVMPLAAAKKGFKPNMDKVRTQVNELKQQGSPEQFQQFLKMQGCANEEEFITKIAPREAIQQFIESLEKGIEVTDKEIREFYDQNAAQMKTYTCSHILAAFDPKNPRNDNITPEMDAAALKKINEVKAELDKGASFEELAKKYSDCPSGKEGGKLGEYNPDTKMQPGQMVPEFTDGFNALKPGEVTATPVKTSFGYHLIKASAVTEKTFEGEAPKIRQHLTGMKMQKKVPEVIEEIKKEYNVKFYEVK